MQVRSISKHICRKGTDKTRGVGILEKVLDVLSVVKC